MYVCMQVYKKLIVKIYSLVGKSLDKRDIHRLSMGRVRVPPMITIVGVIQKYPVHNSERDRAKDQNLRYFGK